MFRDLAPAGDPIMLAAGENDAWREYFAGIDVTLFGSGTSALAAAVTAACRRSGVAAPEVVLPAYACPHLVSAVQFAGARPRLVDLDVDRPWIDLGALEATIGANTVAVIAVSLFGIRERLGDIRQIIRSPSCLLIEDSAQAFPPSLVDDAGSAADMTIVSFGRGKPVSLLGGGAVLVRDEKTAAALRSIPTMASGQRNFALKARLYNLCTSPWVYGWIRRLPFLHLGATRYEPIAAIAGPPTSLSQYLLPNIHAYIEEAPVQGKLRAAVRTMTGQGMVDLPAVCGVGDDVRLLRYPLLVDPRRRDALVAALSGRGLGATALYGRVLPGIAGLESTFGDARAANYPNATSFAARLLTLPTHRRVDDESIGRMMSVIAASV